MRDTHGCSLLNSQEAKEGRDCCKTHVDGIKCNIDIDRECVL